MSPGGFQPQGTKGFNYAKLLALTAGVSALTAGGVAYVGPDGGAATDTGLVYSDSTDTLTVGDPAVTTRVVIDDGGTIWTAGAQTLQFGANGSAFLGITSGGNVTPLNGSNARDLGSSANLFNQIFLGGEAEFVQEADPSAPGASHGSLYAKALTSATYLTAKFPSGNVQIVAGEPFSLQTVDATVTTCLTVAVPTNTVLYTEVMATGYQSGGGNAAGYLLGATYKNVAGTVTAVGALTTTNIHESNAAWDLAPSISGTNVLWRVTGAAATTIDWDCAITRMIVSP